MRILDNNGRTLGRLELDSNDRAATGAAPVSRWRTVGLLALGAVGALAVAGAGDGSDPGAATASTPTVTVAGGQPERVAPSSGATLPDIRSGWQSVELESTGDVTVNGYVVDNVHNTESPLRARYLESLRSHGVTIGTEAGAIGEAVRWCGAIERGEAIALRERTDALADAAVYATPERRRAVARAALIHLCPAYGPGA